MSNTDLANALERFARTIETAPIELVGVMVNVAAGPGGGSVTGLKIEATAGPDGTRTVGMQVTVDAGAYATKSRELVTEIREAAASAATALPAKGWIMSLVDRARSLGNRALETGITTAAAEIIKAYV
ncbi:hypothetical protein [Mesorhizobium sp. M2A.F.Ca.ET.039.01.1.1]|uniref:hypothetical protein n=1 Tax=Mesorhizobium sp. M2A.F.Ca.ET.039.01.1.1 TaxID=2496746 RepID=UPI000FCAB7C5|nr:hypothetical protein [Mesorhizobium sp. M2A.F.Ca.ET.039.01.1.1]RWX71883.1 hypothetical protein EOA24_04260 [Mesorhizobium sp. M2A.F.Ca.ET.039.01.1.1]TIV48077.1 MAG: hypothetical protein E5V96_00250 [Mesorhizobium sp.]